jgi:hypothetical protein
MTCMMGDGNPRFDDSLKKCYNPAKNSQQNWYSQRSITLDFLKRGGFNGQLIGVNDYIMPILLARMYTPKWQESFWSS